MLKSCIYIEHIIEIYILSYVGYKKKRGQVAQQKQREEGRAKLAVSNDEDVSDGGERQGEGSTGQAGLVA